MLPRDKKLNIDNSQVCVFLLGNNFLKDPKIYEELSYAIDLRKNVYIVKQKEFNYPPCIQELLKRANIKGTVEFEGDTNSESFYNAQDKLFELIYESLFPEKDSDKSISLDHLVGVIKGVRPKQPFNSCLN